MEPKKRGRPRKYDPDRALGRAAELFWADGFSATSLDDLARATGMNRPSIYNAFGDKESLYRRTLAQFTSRLKDQSEALLLGEPDLRQAILGFFYAALDVYFSVEPARGCFVMCTAPVEAIAHPEVRDDMHRLIADIDELLARRFAMARDAGEWPGECGGESDGDCDAETAAKLTQATLHSLALRARAGESKAALRRLARSSVDLLVRRVA